MNMHTPLRMCMACREMKPKSELIRLVVENGKVVIDNTMKVQKRGAYVCSNPECAMKLKRSHCAERFLKADGEEAYDEIIKLVSKRLD